MLTRILTAAVFTSLGLHTVAQEAQLSQLSFLQGAWQTQHAWGEMDEHWMAPSNGNMLCMYRCAKNGKPVFYEMVTIEQQDGEQPVLHLRHFGPGGIARESEQGALRFTVESLSANEVWFISDDKQTRIGYKRESDDLLISLLERTRNGETKRDEFRYQRKKP